MKTPSNLQNLSRPIQKMPGFVEGALIKRQLVEQYSLRPAYQRNDYLSWINRAVREATKQKRLNQMLHELEDGDVYMGMKWNSK